MLGIEVDKRLRVFGIPPHLAKHAGIWRAHQLLANYVEAMRDVIADNIVFIDEGTFSLRAIIVDIVVEGLAKQVEAMEMVETLDVRWKTTAVLGINLDLVWSKS